MDLSSHTYYLLIDVCSVFVPLILTFEKRLGFNKILKSYALAWVIPALFFIIWDIIFTKMQIWSFNKTYLLGIKLFGLPIEEILFFVCIPYACVFIYETYKKYFTFKLSIRVTSFISLFLASFLLIIVVQVPERLYTLITFISLGVLLLIDGFVLRNNFLRQFYIVFVVILLPFFVVNGILTGTGLSEPIVSYNNQHNLGIRILTIPIEDIYYGFLLLYSIIFIKERIHKSA